MRETVRFAVMVIRVAVPRTARPPLACSPTMTPVVGRYSAVSIVLGDPGGGLLYYETSRDRLLRVARQSEEKRSTTARWQCFLSYNRADVEEVSDSIESFDDAFIPRVIGVSDEDSVIYSENDAYVLGEIQSRYMWDSSVTIVLIGQWTWSRKCVDWEIDSRLRNDSNNKRNGLMAIQLPSVNGLDVQIPLRLSENLDATKDGYARYYRYASSEKTLRQEIENAFLARTGRAHLIAPARPRRTYNSTCL